MAITTTNARYEGFIFDGENSRTYGVYVTDVEVFGAPVRNVEMISIPGRNGSFALDKGSYENIQVTYKCAMGCESQADFNAGISAFRNMLASRTGYKRLEDEINTSEYRMACFRGGISVPTLNKETATFDVVFDCKPQRYLKSGENEVSVASGGTISNPTLYDASPLLHVWGYGDIGINGDTLSINNDEYGDVLLANKTSKSATSALSFLDESAVLMLNENDDVFVLAGSSVAFPLVFLGGASINITSVAITSSTPYDIPLKHSYSIFGDRVTVSVSLPQLNFTFNQTTQHLRSNINVTINYTEGGMSKTSTTEGQIHAQFNFLSKYRVSLFYRDVTIDKFYNPATAEMTIQPIYGVSTQRPFADDADFYFDLDIGEAYKIENGQTVSVNNAVTIPAKLPVLVPGSNAITYDNTITQFKIVPRWWQL